MLYFSKGCSQQPASGTPQHSEGLMRMQWGLGPECSVLGEGSNWGWTRVLNNCILTI